MNFFEKYRSVKFSYRLYGILLFAILFVAVILSTQNYELTFAAIYSIAGLLLIDAIISRTTNFLHLLAMIIQVGITPFAGMVYGLIMGGDSMLAGQASLLGIAYIVAMSFIGTWLIFRHGNGLLWLRLITCYLTLDFIIPISLASFDILNFNIAMLLGFITLVIVALPWKEGGKKSIKDYPIGIKDSAATKAVKVLLENIKGTEVQDSKGFSTDLIAFSNTRKFYITVLGLNHPIEYDSGSVVYGNNNIQPVIMRTAIEATQSKNGIPVIVNASDSGETFRELEVKYKKNKPYKVLLVSPMKLTEIIK